MFTSLETHETLYIANEVHHLLRRRPAGIEETSFYPGYQPALQYHVV